MVDNNIFEEDVYVPCEQAHKDCFAYREDGTCDCLVNTEFKGKCPFYKNKCEVEKKRMEEIEKLRAKASTPF